MKLKTNRVAAAMMVAASSITLLQSVFAGSPVFTYTSRDMMFCLRKTGAGGGSTGPNDLEINIGQASVYYGATPGTTTTIALFTGTLFSNVFDNLNNTSWSVAAAVPGIGDSGATNIPPTTLWVTAPRSKPNTQATPAWYRNANGTQSTTASKIKAVLDNAVFYSSTVPADATSNTVNTIVVPVGSAHEYGAYVGALGTYQSTFQGDVENTTPSGFTSASTPSRSDLYELRPDGTGTHPLGRYLGYFELRTDGTFVFVASPPSVPLIFSGNGTAQKVSFPTVNGATYTLYYTNSAGLSAPLSTWQTGGSVGGTGSNQFILDSSTDPNRFYTVLGHL